MTDLVRIGVLKLGCIGAAPLLDLIMDERAERKDIAVVSAGSGAKLEPDACEYSANRMAEMKPQLVFIVSPNAALPGPTRAREILLGKNIPIVSISDAPSKKAFYKKNEEGKSVVSVPDNSGFIVLPMDPMIGARKEFLDPSEMALFNAELIKVLSTTGVIRFIQIEMDKLIDSLKDGKELELPKITLKTAKALEAGGFTNPYAYAKAYAALEILPVVAGITTKGCFKEQRPEKYIPMVTAAHEVLRAASKLADEAREIEKAGDSVLRTPHGSSGKRLSKTKLFDKPK